MDTESKLKSSKDTMQISKNFNILQKILLLFYLIVVIFVFIPFFRFDQEYRSIFQESILENNYKWLVYLFLFIMSFFGLNKIIQKIEFVEGKLSRIARQEFIAVFIFALIPVITFLSQLHYN